jgi:hypothetical protein
MLTLESFRTVLGWLRRVERSRHTAFLRYAANRFIDVFVLGPMVVLTLLALVNWMEGKSPFGALAEGYVEAGHAFRSAPAGYVAVAVIPDYSSVEPPIGGKLPVREELATLPRRLITVDEYLQETSRSFERLYMTGVILGLLVLIFLRGRLLIDGFWRLFEQPVTHDRD